MRPPAREVQFETMNEALVEAFPELRVPCRRQLDDWDNFGGAPPGQYTVFGEIFEALGKILVALPEGTPGRTELLERFFAFTDVLLGSDDDVSFLGTDLLAGVVPSHRAGPTVVRRFAGLEVRRWWKTVEADYRSLETGWDDEIIDLWGVRAAIAPLLGELPAHEIPGISHPQDYLAVASLEEARREPDGTVMLVAFGTTYPFVVSRAAHVSADHDTLDRAARDIADHLGGEYPEGSPRVVYRLIPRGERVWQMNVGHEQHTRLGEDAWVADALLRSRASVLDLLAGRLEKLDWRR